MLKIQGLISKAVIIFVATIWAFGCEKSKVPEKAPLFLEPGIHINEINLKKVTYIEDNRLGAVTDLDVHVPIGESRQAIGVAGTFSTTSFEKNSSILRSVTYNDPKPMGFEIDSRLVDLDQDGKKEIFRSSGAAGTYDYLLDWNGEDRWRTSFISSSMNFGDISGNGKLDLVASNGSELRIFNSHGKETAIYDVPQITALVVLEIDKGKGKGETILAAIDGKIWQITDAGKPLQIKFSDEIDDVWEMSIVRHSACKLTKCVAYPTKSGVTLIDILQKKVVARYEAGYLASIKGMPVKFVVGNNQYYALTGLLLYQGKQMAGLKKVLAAVYIYDKNSKLVYQEILETDGNALAVLSDNSQEILLLGGRNIVWKYSLNIH